MFDQNVSNIRINVQNHLLSKNSEPTKPSLPIKKKPRAKKTQKNAEFQDLLFHSFTENYFITNKKIKALEKNSLDINSTKNLNSNSSDLNKNDKTIDSFISEIKLNINTTQNNKKTLKKTTPNSVKKTTLNSSEKAISSKKSNNFPIINDLKEKNLLNNKPLNQHEKKIEATNNWNDDRYKNNYYHLTSGIFHNKEQETSSEEDINFLYRNAKENNKLSSKNNNNNNNDQFKNFETIEPFSSINSKFPVEDSNQTKIFNHHSIQQSILPPNREKKTFSLQKFSYLFDATDQLIPLKESNHSNNQNFITNQFSHLTLNIQNNEQLPSQINNKMNVPNFNNTILNHLSQEINNKKQISFKNIHNNNIFLNDGTNYNLHYSINQNPLLKNFHNDPDNLLNFYTDTNHSDFD